MRKNVMKNFMICSTAAVAIGLIWCCADEVKAEGTASSENIVVWDEASGQWCVKNGDQVNTGYTGVAQNENGWWYIRDGYLDWDYTGVAQNEYGWWYINHGALDWTYTGLAENEYGWWYIRDGAVDWNYTGVAQNEYGWWYIGNGALDWNYTGVAQNEYGWWYIKNGALDWSYTGVAQNEYGWWYIKNGALDWSYTGVAQNENGWWYISNGALDWSYTGLAENEYGWWYISNGALDWSYTGLAEKEDGQWYIQNGGLNSSYTGLVEDGNGFHYVVNGKVNWSESDPEEAKLREYTEQVYSEVGRDLRACFNWVVNNMSYERHNGHITPPAGYTRCQWYSMKAFRDHKGNCYSYAGAFYYLAKYLGYDAEYVEGQVTKRGGGYTPHGWVEIDGKYICDPEGQAEISPYLNFYMMPKGNALLTYLR